MGWLSKLLGRQKPIDGHLDYLDEINDIDSLLKQIEKETTQQDPDYRHLRNLQASVAKKLERVLAYQKKLAPIDNHEATRVMVVYQKFVEEYRELSAAATSISP